MTPETFDALAGFVTRRSGIALNPAKRALAARKLEPVVARFGFQAVTDLVRELAAPGEALARDVVGALTTNETSFFRDPASFAYFRDAIFPTLMAARPVTNKLRIWCAAASTGQEAYSLAMLADAACTPFKDRTVEILASDIAADAITRAREGRYSNDELARGLTPELLSKYFRRDGDGWHVDKALRARVSFGVRNLIDPFVDLGTFDAVLCRNVLIYFDAATKQSVLERLHAALAPDGYLMLGSAETLMGFHAGFRPAGVAGVFVKGRAPARRAAAR